MKPNAALTEAIRYATRRFRESGNHQRVVKVRDGAYDVQDFEKEIPPRALRLTRWTTYELNFRESLDG